MSASHSHEKQPESQDSGSVEPVRGIEDPQPGGQRPERSTTSRGTLRSIPSLMSFGTVGRGASSLRLPVTESESSMRPVSARQTVQTISHGTSQDHAPGQEIHSTQAPHFGLRRSLSKIFDKGKRERSFNTTLHVHSN